MRLLSALMIAQADPKDILIRTEKNTINDRYAGYLSVLVNGNERKLLRTAPAFDSEIDAQEALLQVVEKCKSEF
jgi:hypothetical protein